MLKKKLNRLNIELSLRAVGPVLVKEGERKEDENDKNKRKDEKDNLLKFLKTNKGQGQPYIPGSSLKGLFRSHCESILRILSEGEPLCCDPLEKKDSAFISCAEKFNRAEKKKDYQPFYKFSCPICRIFGNQFTRGRIYVEDGHLEEKITGDLPQRTGAPINRFVGNNNNLFNYEFIVNRDFKTSIKVENFELWQLGMLAYLLRDLANEELRVGFGSARGLGRVKGIIESIEIEYFDPTVEIFKDDKLAVYGIEELAGKDDYSYFSKGSVAIDLAKDNLTTAGIFPSYKLKDDGEGRKGVIWQFLAEVAKKFEAEEVSQWLKL